MQARSKLEWRSGRGAAGWTMDALAEAMAALGVPISASQAWRICKALDLRPWQVESWMTSHDPDYWEKAGDVCGLYLNPPEHAVVWSVGEKSHGLPCGEHGAAPWAEWAGDGLRTGALAPLLLDGAADRFDSACSG